MKLETLKNTLKNYKKGTYTKAKWLSSKKIGNDNLEKITEGIVRFVNYGKVAKTTTIQKQNDNIEVVIKDICYYNKKTKNYLLHMYVSKNPKHKNKTKYYLNGNEITKEKYNSMVKPNPQKIDLMFNKKLQDVISIG